MEVGDPIVDQDEALQVSGGCEPMLHDPLVPPHRQMRILRPVVEALVLAMRDIQAPSHPGRAIRTGLVGDPVPTHFVMRGAYVGNRKVMPARAPKPLGPLFGVIA